MKTNSLVAVINKERRAAQATQMRLEAQVKGLRRQLHDATAASTPSGTEAMVCWPQQQLHEEQQQQQQKVLDDGKAKQVQEHASNTARQKALEADVKRLEGQLKQEKAVMAPQAPSAPRLQTQLHDERIRADLLQQELTSSLNEVKNLRQHLGEKVLQGDFPALAEGSARLQQKLNDSQAGARAAAVQAKITQERLTQEAVSLHQQLQQLQQQRPDLVFAKTALQNQLHSARVKAVQQLNRPNEAFTKEQNRAASKEQMLTQDISDMHQIATAVGSARPSSTTAHADRPLRQQISDLQQQLESAQADAQQKSAQDLNQITALLQEVDEQETRAVKTEAASAASIRAVEGKLNRQGTESAATQQKQSQQLTESHSALHQQVSQVLHLQSELNKQVTHISQLESSLTNQANLATDLQSCLDAQASRVNQLQSSLSEQHARAQKMVDAHATKEEHLSDKLKQQAYYALSSNRKLTKQVAELEKKLVDETGEVTRLQQKLTDGQALVRGVQVAYEREAEVLEQRLQNQQEVATVAQTALESKLTEVQLLRKQLSEGQQRCKTKCNQESLKANAATEQAEHCRQDAKARATELLEDVAALKQKLAVANARVSKLAKSTKDLRDEIASLKREKVQAKTIYNGLLQESSKLQAEAFDLRLSLP